MIAGTLKFWWSFRVYSHYPFANIQKTNINWWTLSWSNSLMWEHDDDFVKVWLWENFYWWSCVLMKLGILVCADSENMKENHQWFFALCPGQCVIVHPNNMFIASFVFQLMIQTNSSAFLHEAFFRILRVFRVRVVRSSSSRHRWPPGS